jgi:tryptophan synthase alpha chain
MTKLLTTYITAGDPNLKATEKLILALEKSGADLVEIGVPFSDPIADGPVIQASHQRALKTTLTDVLVMVKNLRPKVKIPLYLMLAANLVFHYGTQKFYADAKKAGVNGVIIPDLTPDEKQFFQSENAPIDRHGLNQVFLVAPTSTEERIKMISQASSGFIYLVSSVGITGKRKEISPQTAEQVKTIRKYSKLPIQIGFGITTPDQAAEVAQIADGIIIGSANVDMIAKSPKTCVKKVGDFIAKVRRRISVS